MDLGQPPPIARNSHNSMREKENRVDCALYVQDLNKASKHNDNKYQKNKLLLDWLNLVYGIRSAGNVVGEVISGTHCSTLSHKSLGAESQGQVFFYSLSLGGFFSGSR